MPRFFDDYSNTYLTHDSAAGRKQQRRGWKFRENFKLHYEKHLEDWRSGPMGLASAQQAFLQQNGNNPSAPPIPPLPEGWEEIKDEVTRSYYYVHKESGARQWVRPAFVPPSLMNGPPPAGRFAGPPPPFPNKPLSHVGHGPYGAQPPPSSTGPAGTTSQNLPPPPPPIGNFPPPPSGAPPPIGNFPIPPPGAPPPKGSFSPPPRNFSSQT
mmetsp:Transcript_17353/g.24513  ORF Transcript_17353/g.24513 Transcript_17353/m.24513 type:complete len:211 (-) Transcript_17353:395-1027(-)|eukprot:CAMPEP_0184861008 /NCGR_PEP_ID=MMETSP0580-20130426/5787_1 /TAXON_ID=1118495 /ORGANISM="Dactyliosolen fragilissimus" /LENGTH=210 /DNA_ID=CAMNT_0027358331 /DNA_START=118 /DNA_END=750 /DNA_ORIENTATION=-